MVVWLRTDSIKSQLEAAPYSGAGPRDDQANILAVVVDIKKVSRASDEDAISVAPYSTYPKSMYCWETLIPAPPFKYVTGSQTAHSSKT